ncbi:MAG: lysylphosphatidylglycerol synthase transmembrane domain-containing protein [bacterium]
MTRSSASSMAPHSRDLRRRLVRAAVPLFLGALLVAFGRHVNWHAAAAAIRSADAALLLLALVANQLSLALKGVRWWVFLRPLGIRSLSLVLRATFAGASLNNLMVAQGGEGARVLLVSRATGVSSARVTAALALERVLDAASYLTLLVSAVWVLDLSDSIARWRGAASIALAALILALSVLSRSNPRDGKSERAVSPFRAYTRRFADSVSDLASPGRLASGMLLSLGAWALQVVTYHLVARAAHLPISLSGSVSAMLAVGISFLVRATPGNVGVFQAVYAVTVARFGIAESPAVAAALLIQTIQVIPVIVIGTLLAPTLRRQRPLDSARE